jgi:hypothetical protein
VDGTDEAAAKHHEGYGDSRRVAQIVQVLPGKQVEHLNGDDVRELRVLGHVCEEVVVEADETEDFIYLIQTHIRL